MNKLKLRRTIVLAHICNKPDEIADAEIKKLMRKLRKPEEITKDVVCYEVLHVVGSIKPYVGEFLSKEFVADLCEQTGIWTVTFI